MKNLVLAKICSSYPIKGIIVDAINDLLGIKNKYVLDQISYTGNLRTEFHEFIDELADEFGKEMEKAGVRIGKEKFKNFDPKKTKLNSEAEIISEIWLELSKLISEKIGKMLQREGEERGIPGLKNIIKESDVYTPDGEWIALDREKGIAFEANIKKELLEKLPKINDKEELLKRFQNELFSYFQTEFGLYNEQKEKKNEIEPKSEIELSRR